MNTTSMKWLLRREFWEYKGSLFWAPLIVAGVLIVLLAGTLGVGVAKHGLATHVFINGHMVSQGSLTAAATEIAPVATKFASGLYLGASAPLFLILTFTLYAYCLGALFDERRDRSILFWKSLPVSDPMTVLSKVVTAACMAPIITIALGTAASLILLVLGCTVIAFGGLNLFGIVLGTPALYLAPLKLLALLPVYVVWALPTIGWLLLVSSWARTKPFLWAAGVPIVFLILMKWIDAVMSTFAGAPMNLAHAASNIVARLLCGLVPGIWFTFPGAVSGPIVDADNSIDAGAIFIQSWASLGTLDALLGVLCGAAMIYGAMRMRRWRDEG